MKMANNNFHALPLANLDEDSKKRKREENLRTWKWNEVNDVDALRDKQVGKDSGDLHVHEHHENVELDTQSLVDEVFCEFKKRKREANLATTT
ncbi:hypothetical protein Tco_1058750 [Tanacetum coccineum]|uniref:Uncharacterized protein n=1 Tax=Tanacetum coccineum TaxID=301880 RepID=A0ABQ5H972_9ASTR